MIQVTNDFLPNTDFLAIQDYCYKNVFKNVVLENNKQISYLETPNEFLNLLQIQDHELVLTFIRNATENIDTLPNIHANNFVNGSRIDLASILYINQYSDCEINGTSFWNHEIHGMELEKEFSQEEFNRLLIEDSNDVSKWQETDRVKNFPNRQIIYNANMFNSKYPSKLSFGNRIVLCCFYTKKN